MGMRSVQGLSLNKHFAALGAAAAAVTGVGIAQQSEAAVIYSGAVNINIPSTTSGVYLNVVTGANNPAPASAPGWDINPWSSTVFNVFTPTPNPGGGSYIANAPAGTTVMNLAPGTPIGAAGPFGSTGTNTGAAGGFNLNSTNNIIGFRFINEANANAVHFGWARISLSGTASSQPRSIVEYAWEDVAGVGIAAGDTGVPEPTSLALLAAGAGGLMFRRRR